MTGNDIDYCGGEMDGWSDPIAPGDVLVAHVAQGLPADAATVLLVGARAAALAERLAADGREVTALVRGTQDAERLAATNARVVCGSFDSWQPTRFDVAVVLDPPTGVLAASSDGLGALDLVARLRDCAASVIAYVENGAGLPALDRQSRRPDRDDEFATLGAGYDPRPPTPEELPEQPAAVVFADAVVHTSALAEPGVRTLLRSLLVADLRRDALLGDPLRAADGWLFGDLGGKALTYRRLDGTVAHDAPAVDGTPVETRLRQFLLRGDLVRTEQGLRAYARWADGAPAALLRNLVATDRGFTTIDDAVAPVDLPTAMLDLAADLRRSDHPFAPELRHEELAAELLRLARDTADAAAEITSAAADYEGSPIARTPPDDRFETKELVAAVRIRDAQLAAVQADLEKDRRHLRALEHALATESGPRARRAYFLMTAPTKRLVEALRRRR